MPRKPPQGRLQSLVDQPPTLDPSSASTADGDEPYIIDTAPKPPGRKDPRDLLAQLLFAYGWQRSSHPPTLAMPDERKRQLAGPRGNYSEEIEAAEPILIELVARLGALRSTEELPTPDEYEQAWRGIIADWNEAIDGHGWNSMPPLCENCGLPVFLRAPARLSGGGIEHSTTCSARCQGLAKMRKYLAERKARGEPV